MIQMELLDEPVRVKAAMDDEGQITPQKMTWQERRYPLVAVGRQWDEEDGRHVLVESADGTRFELLLSRRDFAWRVKKVWRGQVAV